MDGPYTIQISEFQRRIIMRCLTGVRKEELDMMSKEPGDPNGSGNAKASADHAELIVMFGLLPEQNRDNPKIVHGFCL